MTNLTPGKEARVKACPPSQTSQTNCGIHGFGPVRQLLVLILFATLGTSIDGATFRTRNFVVTAKKAEVARQVAEFAEHYRRSKALDWLGQVLPDWTDPCAVQVRVTMGEAGGATSFAFDNNRVVGQEMTVDGPLDRILNSVLPHEITHTVFAARFGRPLPRWADEGGAVLSEDYQELARHDLLVRELINQGRMIPLSRLFALTEYPDDVMALYAQGFSVANYLVSIAGRLRFLDFVWDGQVAGWDRALHAYYGIYSADELEQRWIAWLREGRGTGADRPMLASRGPSSTRPSSPPVARAQMADDPWQPPVASTNQRADARGKRNSPFDPSLQVALTNGETEEKDSTIVTGHPWLTGLDASQASTSAMGPRKSEPAELRAATTKETRPRLIPIAVGRTRRGHGS